jgi:Dimethlysulfonioproprionate lyase
MLAVTDRTTQDLIDRVRDLVFSLDTPRLTPFLEAWPSTVERGTARGTDAQTSPPALASLPALRWLANIAPGRAGFAAAVIAALCRSSPWLTWRQTYTAAEIDTGFLDNYAYTEAVGLNGPLMSREIACGFLLLGAGTLYPRHRHEAQEIYVPLSGTAAWQQGDSIWREHPPGTLIYHASGEMHAMRTGDRPLLALYLWRSINLDQRAHLDATI